MARMTIVANLQAETDQIDLVKAMLLRLIEGKDDLS